MSSVDRTKSTRSKCQPKWGSERLSFKSILSKKIEVLYKRRRRKTLRWREGYKR